MEGAEGSDREADDPSVREPMSAASRLTDDLVLQILSRLPARALQYRFDQVRRSPATGATSSATPRAPHEDDPDPGWPASCTSALEPLLRRQQRLLSSLHQCASPRVRPFVPDQLLRLPHLPVPERRAADGSGAWLVWCGVDWCLLV